MVWSLATVLLVPGFLQSQSQAPAPGSSPIRSKKYSLGFEFIDKPNVVTVRGSRWIELVPTGGVTSRGPGATVECTVGIQACVVTEFFDGGATSVDTTYRISRWDSDRIEAENGSVDIPSKNLSEGYRQELAATCLILNRTKKQVFSARKQKGQSCRQLDEDLDGRNVARAEQLCALRNGDPTIYDCPNPPRPTDKHGNAVPK